MHSRHWRRVSVCRLREKNTDAPVYLDKAMVDSIDTVYVPVKAAKDYEEGHEWYYPEKIVLPRQKDTKGRNALYKQLGIKYKQPIIGKLLEVYGYETRDGVTYTRPNGVRVVLETNPYYLQNKISTRVRYGIYADLYQLGRIYYFGDTEEGFGDLLELNGYRLEGDYYVRDAPLPLYKDKELQSYLLSNEEVTITHKDLQSLKAVTRSRYDFGVMADYRWANLDDFISLHSKELGIRPDLLKYIVMYIEAPRKYKGRVARKAHFVPKTYPERTQFHGLPPKGMSLADAVRGGYTFPLSMYRAQVQKLVLLGLREEQLEELVDFLQRYPDVYNVLVGVGLEESLAYDVVESLYGRDNLEPYEYLYGYIFNKPLDPGHTVHPIVLYISFLSKVPKDDVDLLREVAGRMGMYIPPDVSNVAEYIWTNIRKYTRVLDRPEDIKPLAELSPDDPLDQYTDFELIEYFGKTHRV